MLTALMFSLAGLAASSPSDPELSWTAPAECPDHSRGAEHLRRFLGGRTPTTPVRVTLSADGVGYVARVELDGGVRTLRADDCETLARAAALVVAVSLDPVATASAVAAEQQHGPTPELALGVPEPEPAPAPARSRRPPPLASADQPARPEPRPAAPTTTHSIGMSGGIGQTIVPSLTGAVRLGHALDRGAFRLQTNLTYAPPRIVTYPDEPSVGGRFQSAGLGVRACFAPASTRVTVPLCAGLEGGPVIGRGVGIEQARRPVDAWVGGLASAAVVVRLHARVAVTVTAELIASLRRPAFHVGSRETLFRSPLVGLRGLAGLELRVW